MPSIPLKELPDWPRVMTRAVAAAYLDVSLSYFTKHYEKQIRPVDYNRPIRFDRKLLDELIDQSGKDGSTGKVVNKLIDDLL